MGLVARLNAIDAKLQVLVSVELAKEYSAILRMTGPKFYLKLNEFEKKIGLK